MSTRTLYSGIAIVILVALVIAIAFFRAGSVGPSPNASQTASTTTQTLTSSSTGTAINITSSPGVTVTQISSVALPDFKAPLTCAASVSADRCSALRADAKIQANALSKDSTNFKAWIGLGSDRKQAGEYTKAATAWEYVSTIYPTNVVSFNNLGDLYMNFIHDYTRAESNYLIEIKNKADNPEPYRALYQLYVLKKNNAAAENILKKGISANPSATDLKVLLARLYVSLGRTADAKVQYQAAIAGANAAGQTSVANQIEQELKQLQ
jgi:lipopolysaccharide biosynthesis regulator YciM